MQGPSATSAAALSRKGWKEASPRCSLPTPQGLEGSSSSEPGWCLHRPIPCTRSLGYCALAASLKDRKLLGGQGVYIRPCHHPALPPPTLPAQAQDGSVCACVSMAELGAEAAGDLMAPSVGSRVGWQREHQLEATGPGLQAQHCHFLAVWLRTSSLTFLSRVSSLVNEDSPACIVCGCEGTK